MTADFMQTSNQHLKMSGEGLHLMNSKQSQPFNNS